LIGYSPPEVVTLLSDVPGYLPIGSVLLDGCSHGIFKFAPQVTRARRSRSCGVAEMVYGITPIKIRSTRTALEAARSIHNVDIARAIIARSDVDNGATDVDAEYIVEGEMNYPVEQWQCLIRLAQTFIKTDGKVKLDLSALEALCPDDPIGRPPRVEPFRLRAYVDRRRVVALRGGGERGLVYDAG